jgi:hypothetical protein
VLVTDDMDDYSSDEDMDDGYIQNKFTSLLFIAPFPMIDWYLDLNSIAMKHPEADVYYSTSIVSSYLHRMATLNLDKLASIKKDYFVPMYHNSIDPNMTAIEQESIYQWTAIDFIIEELNISKVNT